MKRSTLYGLKLFAILVAIMFAACQADTDKDSFKMLADQVEFNAYINESSEIRTRTLSFKDIASNPFDMDFYIQLCCDENEVGASSFTEIGTYVVPSGFEGRLAAKENQKPLMWKDLTSPHTFYAWNIPWNEESTVYDKNDKYAPSETDKIDNGIQIKFYNSSEKDGYDTYKNNAIYENFIGAKSEAPYSYKEHGKYVDLTFHHLVSKIRIGSFILIEASGAIQKDLSADLTFVGMPTEATFYPHPRGDGRPCVEQKEPSENNGVTFYINNETPEDVFYVCPEIDFSKIDFKVKINDIHYADYDTYYGTFDDVEFVRQPGTDYDQENDEKILHAGEMMTLNIVLIPGIGPGLSIFIDKWNTEQWRESQYHTKPGIYSDAEVKELIDLFYNQKTYDYDGIKEVIERLFEMYGVDEITEDGKMVFQLFENVIYDSNILPIWKDCILDGMGHTITMKTNSNNTSYVTGPYFNIGPVRDVYLTDGTNTIYIDKQGYVWIADPDIPGGYKQTENKLEPLTGDEKSYDISCKDGKVHKSTYYNNNIVGS